MIRDGFSSTDYQPVAETFFGYRAFKVTTEGHAPPAGGIPGPSLLRPGTEIRGGLRGVFKSNFQWGVGHNTAMCLRTLPAHGRVGGKPHQLLLPECDCGFWAYTAGEHLLRVEGAAVLGIIEGWGRMVLGPHGFRAEKARIVALAFPAKREDVAVQIDSSGAVVSDVLRRGVAALSEAFVAASVSVQEAANRLRALNGQPGRPVRAPSGGALPRANVAQSTPRPWELIDESLRADIRRAYPGVLAFQSVAAMQRAFPLSDLTRLLPAEDGTAERAS